MSDTNRESVSAFTSSGRFDGFGEADFDAYVAKKRTSNAYTLERRRAKDRLLALAHAVSAELDEDLDGLELLGSDEAPTVANGRRVDAQWAFFLREAPSRAELKPLLLSTDLTPGANLFDIAVQHQHANIALRLDDAGLRIGFDVAEKAKVDRENIAVKLEIAEERPTFIDRCEALSVEAVVGPPDLQRGALDVDEDCIASWVAAIREGSGFTAFVQLPRQEPLLASDALMGTATQLVGAFIELYRFLAWHPGNDHARVRAEIKKSEDEKVEAVSASFSPGDRVMILSGLFAGRAGYLAEIAKGKAKVMVGPVSVGIDVKDIRSA